MNANTAVAQRPPVAEVRHQLDGMGDQFRAALPAHISVDRFKRVVMTAVQQNPELLECDRRSLWNAAIRAAQDGLLPDGREGAMVVRWSGKNGKSANWQPMVAGIRKKVRNSGEIATWDTRAVYANDAFEYEEGDNPRIFHKPALGERGAIVAVYSIATLKSGEKTRDVMSIEEVRAIRDRYSDAWKAFKAGKIKSTPWADSEAEMAKKTVARRHSKELPMSTDLDEMLHREGEPIEGPEAQAIAAAPRPTSLSGRLNALAAVPDEVEAEEEVDEETGEITTAAPAVVEAETARPTDPREWAVADAYHFGEEARAKGVARKAVVPPEIRENKELSAAVIGGWEAAAPAEAEPRA